MLPRILLAFSLLLAAPVATAHHVCDDGAPVWCVGGNYHEEGEGTCPGEKAESRLVVGYEGSATGRYMLAGAGWACEGDEMRQGIFLEGAPQTAFAGVYENDTHCGAAAGAGIYVFYEQTRDERAITCMLA